MTLLETTTLWKTTGEGFDEAARLIENLAATIDLLQSTGGPEARELAGNSIDVATKYAAMLRTSAGQFADLAQQEMNEAISPGFSTRK